MTAQAAVLQPLRLPNFALFWTAQALSKLGDPITLIALAAVTYRMTGSALSTAAAVLVTFVPSAVFGFAAGAVSDALGHRRAMVVCDVARVGLIAAIPLLLGAGAPITAVLAVAFVAGVFTAVFNPARLSLVPLLVGPRELGSGNALLFATDRTVEIVGALIGGLLVAAIGTAAFYLDAATFALSAILLSRIRLEEPPGRRLSLAGIWADVASGLSFIRRSEVLFANTVLSLVAQLSLPLYNGLLPVLVFRRFSGGDADLGAWQFGVAEAALALGAVAGAVVLPQYMRRFRKGVLVVAGFGGYGLVLVAVGLAPSFPALVAFAVAAGAVNMVFFIPNVTISQEVTPPEMRGRVFGARSALLYSSWLPIVLAAGWLADVVDVGMLIVAGGLLTSLTALVGSRVRVIRTTA